MIQVRSGGFHRNSRGESGEKGSNSVCILKGEQLEFSSRLWERSYKEDWDFGSARWEEKVAFNCHRGDPGGSWFGEVRFCTRCALGTHDTSKMRCQTGSWTHSEAQSPRDPNERLSGWRLSGGNSSRASQAGEGGPRSLRRICSVSQRRSKASASAFGVVYF